MNHRLAASAMGAAVLLGSVACGDGDTESEQPAGTVSSSPAVATSSAATTTSASSSAAPSSTAASLPDLSASAPAAGTPAAVAWEALTGPDGEYVAEATYAAVIDTFGQVEPYLTIRAAEQQHASALVRQLERFGVNAPDNPYLGKVQAPGDLKAAAQAGVSAEVANVKMYDKLLTQTTDAALTRVLTNLRSASEGAHLPLFQAAAENDGTLTKQQMIDLGLGGGR